MINVATGKVFPILGPPYVEFTSFTSPTTVSNYYTNKWQRYDITYEDGGHRSKEVMANIANTENYVTDYCG